ncbi:unnamed protein product, partial [Polarella glacialis]
VPFDEFTLLNENLEYLQEKMKLPITVSLAENPVSPDHADSASNAQPGKPAVHFVVEGGKPAAGKAAAKPAAKSAAGSGYKA